MSRLYGWMKGTKEWQPCGDLDEKKSAQENTI